MIKKLLFIVLLFTGIMGRADEVRFTMSAPEIVTVGEQFSLTLSLNAKGEDLRMPELANFDILMGPSVSSSRSFQSINGKMTQSVNYSYTYILQASQEGNYTLSPATISSGKKRYQSNALSIKVIQGRQPATTGGGSTQGAQQNSNNAAISSEQLFIRFETDKKTVFKGEMIMATFKLYSRVGLSVVDQSMPSFEGFWTQDIDLPQADQTRTREAVDGIIYNVYTLQKKILIPQQSGRLTIEPAEMIFDVQQRVQPQSIFDDFFGSVQNVRTKASSERVSITVKDLPPAPAGFSGAVGKFSLQSSINKQEIKANEAITLRTQIEGSGNLKHLSAFKYNFPPDFEVYDPNTTYNIRATDAGLTGTTTFEQVVIPRFAGEFIIPSLPFVYFDPGTKKYITLNTREFAIKVEKGADDQQTTVVSSLSKEDVRLIGQDIRYINTANIQLRPFGDHFFASLQFWLMYVISLLLFIILVLVLRKKARENANAALMRNKKASRIARKHLKAASHCAKNNNTDDFYEALLKAFWGYLSDKLNLPISELSRDNARSTLSSHNVDNSTIDEFMQLIDTCEMARFAPSAVDQSVAELYKKGEEMIGKFEKQIRKK